MKSSSTVESGSWLEVVRRQVERIRFGSVQIIVHEGRVTQVESLEKTRLSSAEPALVERPPAETNFPSQSIS